MKLKVFLDHPVLSIVLSILIVIVGIFSIISLPIEQYPDMAPPTINVSANYPGASAETVQKSVIVPLEQAINGVENMTYITSSASNSGDISHIFSTIDSLFQWNNDTFLYRFGTSTWITCRYIYSRWCHIWILLYW